MSRKSLFLGVAILLVASCAWAQMNQTWSAMLGNGAMQNGGIGISTSVNAASLSNTQSAFSWTGGSFQTNSAGFGQFAIAGGVGSAQGVGQTIGGFGGQTIGAGMSQGLVLGAGQTVGTTTGWVGGANGTQGGTVSQTQVVGSWSGISTQSQQASVFQSGTVISGLGGSGSVHQGAFVTSSQSQN